MPAGPTLPLTKPAGRPIFAEPYAVLRDTRSGLGQLLDIAGKSERNVIGLMTGTSLDAIDLAYVRIRGRSPGPVQATIIASWSFEYPPDIKKRVKALITPEENPTTLLGKLTLIAKIARQVLVGKYRTGTAAALKEICILDQLLGEAYAGAVNEFLEYHHIPHHEVDLVATAGQTVWHEPHLMKFYIDWLRREISTRATLAIGQGAVIAERTGICTLSDLRVRDVAAGGHGAPIVPYADFVLLQDEHAARAIQNIGGVGNVTYLPSKPSGKDRVIAFDTGPGNMQIDYLALVATQGAQEFDRNGELARQGTVRRDLLEAWLSDPYFKEEPPKTTGREKFGEQFGKRILKANPSVPIVDLIATATALTVESIARAYEDFLINRGLRIDEVILGGGGAMNPVIREGLAKRLGIPILTHEDVGISSQFKEPMAIAIIGDDSAAGLDTNVTGATGGSPTILGKISYARSKD